MNKKEPDFRKHYYELSSYYNNIKYSDKNIDMLRQMYIKLKEIIPYYYNKGKMNRKYDNLIEILIKAENLFNGEYILNRKISIDGNLKLKNEPSKDEILNYIVNRVRLYLDNFCYKNLRNYEDINSLSFENMCGYSSTYVIELCNKLNIRSYMINIEPGYLHESYLFGGSNHHYCTIIELDNEYYLIDCTYKQFFKKGKTDLERLGIVNCSPPRAGAYMLLDDKRRKVASIILEKGYIKLTEETFKDYLDGFTMSFRNGLYYENTKDFTYTTRYTSDDYINFIKGKDDQLYYEPEEFLGFQRRPLDNNKLSFKLSQ